MLYAEICPKVERHASGRALCLLTLGHISAYNMVNTILLLLLLWMSLVILKNEICLKCIDSIKIGK